MALFKDLLRFVALFLVIGACIRDSVAWAICAGTLYMGGFDGSFAILRHLPRRKSGAQVLRMVRESHSPRDVA